MQKRALKEASFIMYSLLTLIIIFNLYSPFMIKASSDITVKGRLTINHMGQPQGEIIPIPNALVEIYDEEIIQYPFVGWGHLPWPDVLLGTTYTDDNGYFSFSVNNDDGSTILGDEKGRDIYVKVVAKNRAAVVRNDPDWFFGTVFMHKMGTYADLEDGEVKDLSIHPDTPSYQVAFELLHNVYQARQFVIDETGITPGKINVFYKDSFHNEVFGSYYLPNSIGEYLATVPTPSLPPEYYPNEIITLLLPLASDGILPFEADIIRSVTGIHFDDDITLNSRRYYEVIYHEYGHHVMNELFDLGPPFPYAGTHYVTVEYHPDHAWIEGWAEFFSSIARKYYDITDYVSVGTNLNIENMEFDYEGDPKNWDSVEGNIAGILWDLHDSTNEYFDGLSLSFNEIVTIIKSYDPRPLPDETWPLWADHPWQIYMIFDAFVDNNNPDLTSKFWNILINSGIDIPDSDPPMNPSSYTSSHNSVIPLNQAVIKVDVYGAVDTISGVKGFYYMWNPTYFPNINDVINEIDFESNWNYQRWSHFEEDTYFSRDEYYLYLITVDNAGNFAENIFTAGPFKVHEINTLQIEGIVTTSLGEIYGTGFTEVTVPTLEYPTKTYQATKFHIFGGDLISEPIEFTGSFDLSGKTDGTYQMKILGIDGEVSDELHILSINIDNTEPEVWITVGAPSYVNGATYVNRDTVFTIGTMDLGSGVKSVEYSFNDVDWIPYNGGFMLPALEDGEVTVYARATDNLDNRGYAEVEVVLDNTPPDALVVIGAPKVVSESTYITSSSLITINADEFGCGVDSVYYKLYIDVEPEEWTLYADSFSVPPVDGIYTLDFKAIDNLANTHQNTLTLVNDNTGPVLEISPPSGTALQDILEFNIDAVDQSGVESVKITIRGSDNPDVSIGFDELDAKFDSVNWLYELNTWNLDDGHYIVFVSSTDGLGNTATIESQYSIRNGALIELLPSTPNHKAGRTVPIKFTLRVSTEIDPLEPFVYNENLIIRIKDNGGVLQDSTFGPHSKDYRIDTDSQLYITNFKTTKQRQEYTVEIYRLNFLIDSFTFSTTK